MKTKAMKQPILLSKGKTKPTQVKFLKASVEQAEVFLLKKGGRRLLVVGFRCQVSGVRFQVSGFRFLTFLK